LIQHGSMSRHTTPISSTMAGHSTVTVETAGTASLRYHSHHQSSVSSARRFPVSGKPAGASLHRQRNPTTNCSMSTNSDSIDHSSNAVNRNVKVIILQIF
jgi:hypothetical protein